MIMETDGHDMASRRGTKDYGQAPEARRGKEGVFPCSLEPSEGVWHPDTLISGSGLQGNKKISVSVAVFVVLCYNNSGKLAHKPYVKYVLKCISYSYKKVKAFYLVRDKFHPYHFWT